MTTITVVISTVRGREESLRRCLDGLARQTRPPDEILVIRDRATPVAALRAAWVLCTACEWVAPLDDDAIPPSDWLERIEAHLRDPQLGAVGGRILNIVAGEPTAHQFESGPVASLSWYGRTRSHLHDVPKTPIVCEADFLQGSNMCVRRGAVEDIDPDLDFGIPGFELSVCQRLRRAGWRVRFDSEILVRHYPAARPPHLARHNRVRFAHEYSRNLVVALLHELSWPRKLIFLAYFLLVGQRQSPGLLVAPYFLLRRRSRARCVAAWRGKWEGVKTCVSRS
jgi:GT2 family glycosyltransferase